MGCSCDIISSLQPMMAEQSLLLRVLGVVLYLVNWTAVNYVSTSIFVPSVYYITALPTPTENGVPYIVSIFAENSAGNGTKCNVTDFTNELGESWYTITKQLQLSNIKSYITDLMNNAALMCIPLEQPL